MEKITRLAVMASGNGTNFAALLAYIKQAKLPVEIVRLVVDHDDVKVIDLAKEAQVPVFTIIYKDYPNRETAEKQILQQLADDEIDGILLAGYMRILTPQFVKAYPQKIINIHPALLPSFPGRHGIDDAYNYGVKVTGVTIHFVNDGVDSGKIIAQEPVRIKDDDSLDSLEAKIHTVEHKLYPKTLQKLIKEGVFKS
ncbi:phosphoribosylglycinamide formyltransferase [Fructilactobacillus sanfranciscensis]|uniref:phosphoribosylglycinamide formyltransferase n=1 Tax=Fructilactobacillus sanfranciscensis TaxID=1625 RepID=UPI000704AC5D|nr:phosphoribosylglycinamide formyltransferase [Fructilactobacillus sanfranciscensis]MDN4462423.1 phosphoribosylglycinamide formyltransferase [Fructilactobacillus sanfranciscensis]NDR61407.1 phosphoribosylglycinamide formyltransferase [Fructilactobacillus sanfranciscensis]POH22932.1 phosphoribosylglycinamide formyltransferase [Fructilactobacillus sanfranciscensis DSM 20451]QFX93813.1 phosphoribosylglycinamide formyltransferase [Fructilactobacillus sanfranciscensis]RDX59558.1 phosphoribosylglyc